VTERPYQSPEPESVGRIPPYLRMASAGGSAAEAPGRDSEGVESLSARSATLRPFVLTSGRVDAGDRELGLETQVTLRHKADPAVPLTPEKQAIVGLCGRPISVAELSALLHLHLGVAKILVADLRAAGYLDVHVADTLNAQSPETILRVMRGLRAIS
jgi:hypothetical protein